MKIGDRVVLKRFNGSIEGPEDCGACENYWLLIGQRGKVEEERGERVTVVFDDEVRKLGLHCHNPIPNSLYILKSDLAVY